MLSIKKKGPRKPPKSIRASLEPAQADAEPQQINLLDSAAVKRELDEATARVSQSSFLFRLYLRTPLIVPVHSGCQGSWVPRRPLREQCQDLSGPHHVSQTVNLFAEPLSPPS